MTTYTIPKNEVWIKNPDLFSTNSVYMLAKNISYSYSNIVSYNPTTNVSVLETGETLGGSVNYERRKGTNSYSGFDGLLIKLSGVIDMNNLGSVSGYYTITPGLIYTMLVNGHRRYQLYDSKIGSALISDPDYMSAVKTPYNAGSAIPVILLTADMNTNDKENIINYTMSFREDKQNG